jgi:Bax protein
MTVVNRALMLLMPLFAFAVAGAIYTPTASQNTLPGEGEGEVTLSSLPPLPNWANEGLPDFSTYQDTTEKKVAFFSVVSW